MIMKDGELRLESKLVGSITLTVANNSRSIPGDTTTSNTTSSGQAVMGNIHGRTMLRLPITSRL